MKTSCLIGTNIHYITLHYSKSAGEHEKNNKKAVLAQTTLVKREQNKIPDNYTCVAIGEKVSQMAVSESASQSYKVDFLFTNSLN